MSPQESIQAAKKDGYSYIITFGGKLHLDDWAVMTSLTKLTYEKGRFLSEWLPSILEKGKMERAVFCLTD